MNAYWLFAIAGVCFVIAITLSKYDRYLTRRRNEEVQAQYRAWIDSMDRDDQA